VREGGGLPPESVPSDSCFGVGWKSEGIEATLGRQPLRILDALLWGVAINRVTLKHFEVIVLICTFLFCEIPPCVHLLDFVHEINTMVFNCDFIQRDIRSCRHFFRGV
jgi:hypothetical protein